MKTHADLCILCSRKTPQRCAYCHEPICNRCHITRHAKSYCCTQHRDGDSGVGNFVRRMERSMRQYLY